MHWATAVYLPVFSVLLSYWLLYVCMSGQVVVDSIAALPRNEGGTRRQEEVFALQQVHTHRYTY